MRGGWLAALLALLVASPAGAQARAAVAPSPLASSRIAALPDSLRARWSAYVARSAALAHADRAALDAALAREGIPHAVRAPLAVESFAYPGAMPAAWFATDSARRIAEIIRSFQTPAGGWSKHVKLTDHPRRPSESYTAEGDDWQWAETIDMGATTSEIRYLIATDAAAPDPVAREAARRGLAWLLDAQMPNGCWPQVYPLMGGYHDAVAIADDGMANVLALLADAAERPSPASAPLAPRIDAALAAGRACVLRLRQRVGDAYSAWSFYYDPFTGETIAGRSWEPAALAPLESAALLEQLLRIPSPSDSVQQVIHGTAAWLARTGLSGWRYRGFDLVRDSAAGPLWPRLVDNGWRPIFANRDGVVRHDWHELDDRRTGYIWFGDDPARVLELYARWAEAHPATGALAPAKTPVDSIARLPGRRVELDTSSMVTPARLARLGAGARERWTRYVARSAALGRVDHQAMAAELTRVGRTAMRRAAWAHDFQGTAQRAGAWFATDSAARLGESILSFQTPSGGWSKHVDFGAGVRLPGTSFNGESAEWRFTPTIDNSSTTEEILFLARLDSVRRDARYESAVARGIRYLLDAQMPTGCWPQVYPLEGGYHDAATFNDDAIVNVARLLRGVASGAEAVSDPSLRPRAAEAVHGAVQCMLDAQVVVRGRRTVWGQQHDPLTLAPVSARSYELASLTGQESVGVAEFLMTEPEPDARIVAAVHAAADWFRAHRITGLRYSHYVRTPDPSAPPVWARLADLRTGQPIFANRDGVRLTDYDRLTDRRRGYGWYTDAPAAFLRDYDSWARAHPRRAAR